MKFKWPSIIVLTLVLAGCSEEVNNSYPTLLAAKSEIEQGWIPKILPPSTIEIRESHNLDLNTGHGTFSFGRMDAEQFKKSLANVEESEPLQVTEINRNHLKQEGFDLYKFEEFYLAVDWIKCKGQFWLKYSR